MGLIRRLKVTQRATDVCVIESEMRRSLNEPRLPTLFGELPDLRDSGRGTLLTDKTVNGAERYWSDDNVLENGARLGPLQGGPTTW